MRRSITCHASEGDDLNDPTSHDKVQMWTLHARRLLASQQQLLGQMAHKIKSATHLGLEDSKRGSPFLMGRVFTGCDQKQHHTYLGSTKINSISAFA